ncbi:MAG: PLP-dependent transferase [Rhodococcus ruber]|nr:PLP-dependent transferase [Rhodococcus ruber]
MAGHLACYPAVARVIYPGRNDHPQADVIARQMTGGSTLICFDVKGGKKAAFGLQNALDIIKISNNLGDAKSLITHPATTTHRAMGPDGRAAIGLSDGVVRLSVGLEDPEDLLEDFEQALR